MGIGDLMKIFKQREQELLRQNKKRHEEIRRNTQKKRLEIINEAEKRKGFSTGNYVLYCDGRRRK